MQLSSLASGLVLLVVSKGPTFQNILKINFDISFSIPKLCPNGDGKKSTSNNVSGLFYGFWLRNRNNYARIKLLIGKG